MSAALVPAASDDLPPFARWPVLALGAAVGAVLLLTSGRYGYFGDELYFLAAGQRLSWGYADQPPLLPLLARAADELAGGSLLALRTPSMVLTVLGIVLTALIARELGGGRRAQVLAAAAFPTSGFLLSAGHLLYTATVDVFGWTLVTWLLVRWTRTRRDPLLVGVGAAVAVTLQAKYLIVALCVVAVGCLLAVGPRAALRRPALWLGAGLAAVSAVPGLIWQATNGWPQLRMGQVIAAESGESGRLFFLPGLLLTAGLLVGAVLLCYGQWRLLRADRLRDYRYLGWTTLLLAVVFLAAGGRPYYLAGVFPLLWAVAAVELQERRPARWWRWIPSRPVYALSMLFALNSLPVVPASWHSDNADLVTRGSLGWPELADTVAGAYRALPAEQQAGAVLVADNYWRASALEWFGPDRGLPPTYSANRGYAYFGAPPDDSGLVLFVGDDPGELREHFGSAQQVASVRSPGVTHTVWLCADRQRPWSQIWPTYRDL
ncbi:glycosyltransferase family 39 protein [Solwaraspora sp. WMMD1047]|uniref:ArnT family glycosyltransferase n=1 Tax=Solwaraspora sp. WMMD1047 TaxID=3016102 RepID=UPI002417E55E|nr:glycosyltransferase family 39 protein [Solwaraspora sp. WMMD1047]MDG4827810.1 glycosyltransferase family 39 protein [Solwaraspora sp. WMMD1047]